MVTSDPNITQASSEEISEEELNSEVELLDGQELLRKVVLANGLENSKQFSTDASVPSTDPDVERATEKLRSKLTVEPVRKTNIISVTYESTDPDMAAQVLKSLASFYLDKHLEVHRASGEFTFFDQQTQRYRKGLQDAEGRLLAFAKQHGVVSADLERDLTLQKMAELKETYEQTKAEVQGTEQRIQKLSEQEATLPSRKITQIRTSENPQLMQQMKSTLLDLELKRTELLAKFDESYRPVQEVEQQIAETHSAIDKEEAAPAREETSDQDPAHEWVEEELAKAQTDLVGLKAKAQANEAALREYQANASKMQEAAMVQQDLVRDQKTQEQNYLLYLQKSEQSRISDALDQRGILNVAIAEQPTVPALPVRSALPYVMLSVFLAVAGSFSLSVVSDFLNPFFRTPTELRSYLGAPVLASIPKDRLELTQGEE